MDFAPIHIRSDPIESASLSLVWSSATSGASMLDICCRTCRQRGGGDGAGFRGLGFGVQKRHRKETQKVSWYLMRMAGFGGEKGPKDPLRKPTNVGSPKKDTIQTSLAVLREPQVQFDKGPIP